MPPDTVLPLRLIAAAVRFAVVPPGRVIAAETLMAAVLASPMLRVVAVMVFSSVWERASVFAMVSEVEPRSMFLPTVFGAMETVGALMTDEARMLMLSARMAMPPGALVEIFGGSAALSVFMNIPNELVPPPVVPTTLTLPVPLLISCATLPLNSKSTPGLLPPLPGPPVPLTLTLPLPVDWIVPATHTPRLPLPVAPPPAMPTMVMLPLAVVIWVLLSISNPAFALELVPPAVPLIVMEPLPTLVTEVLGSSMKPLLSVPVPSPPTPVMMISPPAAAIEPPVT